MNVIFMRDQSSGAGASVEIGAVEIQDLATATGLDFVLR